MFGINSLEQVKQIAQGYTNWALGREDELSAKRLAICRECPLYDADTDRCSNKRGMNTVTGEIVSLPGENIVMGCGCYMKKKSRVLSAKCVLKKW